MLRKHHATEALSKWLFFIVAMYLATSEDDQANIQKHQLPNIHKTFLSNGSV
jgi:hypothetical protein